MFRSAPNIPAHLRSRPANTFSHTQITMQRSARQTIRLFSTPPNRDLHNALERSELKEILVDIRILQRTCQMANFAWMRSGKYNHLSLQEAQEKQRSLMPKMKSVASQLSDDDLQKVRDEAEKEAAIEIEATSGAPSFPFGK